MVASLVGGRMAGAAKPEQRLPAQQLRWNVSETENFRVLNYGARPSDRDVGAACETLRTQLAAEWLGAPAAEWRPKCDLVLHPSDASYDREVGSGGRSTVASALVDRRQGQVSLRRIDVRATRENWQQAALAHELTHVVLAERFDPQVLPRWLDEGIAIQADSASKRSQHLRRAGHDIRQGSHFALAELLLLQGYPPARRWGTFYDQSAALVEFLVAEQGRQRLLEFIDLAHEQGYDRAFQQVYAMETVELERRWHRALLNPPEAGPAAAALQPVGWMAAGSGG